MTLIEVKIVLRNGMIIKTRCEKMEIKRNMIDGSFNGYSMEGIKGLVPQYIDYCEILAITTEKKEYEDD